MPQVKLARNIEVTNTNGRPVGTVRLNSEPSGADIGSTNTPGIYEARLQQLTGQFEDRKFALNIDPAESDLDLATIDSLTSAIAGTKARLLEADEMSLASRVDNRFSWSQLLLLVLVALLLVEQLLAYSASYHPRAQFHLRPSCRGGGAMIIPTCLFAETSTRTYYELARLNVLNEWWHWLVLAAVVVLLVAVVLITYRRDASDLPKPLGWLLSGLRIASFLGLFVFFLQLEKRIEHKVVKNSRAIVLIDTSQSMGLDDALDSTGKSITRIQQVIGTLQDETLLPELRDQHDVVVYRFDEGDRPTQVASLPRTGTTQSQQEQADSSATQSSLMAQRLARIGLGFLALACLAMFAHLIFRAAFHQLGGESWALLVAICAAFIGCVTFAVGNLRYPEYGFGVAFGEPRVVEVDEQGSPMNRSTDDVESNENVDWAAQLKPSGVETRLGDAISYLVEHERGGPLAGIVLVTDGNQNSGCRSHGIVGVGATSGSPPVPDRGRFSRPASVASGCRCGSACASLSRRYVYDQSVCPVFRLAGSRSAIEATVTTGHKCRELDQQRDTDRPAIAASR